MSSRIMLLSLLAARTAALSRAPRLVSQGARVASGGSRRRPAARGPRSAAAGADGDGAAGEADYGATVLLPETSFPQRAGAVTTEPRVQKYWDDAGVYARARDREGAPTWTLLSENETLASSCS